MKFAPWNVTLGICLLACSFLRAEPANKDVFDIIGVTPLQAASLMHGAASPMHRLLLQEVVPRPYCAASAWVGLKMSAEHRREFMQALREKHVNFLESREENWDTLLDLLEEEGRVDEALAFLSAEELLGDAALPRMVGNQPRMIQYALMRRAGFLIKAGKKAEAQELIGKVDDTYSAYPWTAITAVDLAMGRTQQVLDTVEFLLRETAVDSNSFELLARQQLQMTQAIGSVDALVAADVPTALRVVRLNILGRNDEAAALWKAALPTLSASDVLRLWHVKDFKTASEFSARAAVLINAADVSANQKAALIQAFADRVKRLELFFAMKTGHVEVICKAGWEALILPSGVVNDRPDLSAYLARCDALLAIYPEEPRLHFMRAACVNLDDLSYRISLAAAAQANEADSSIACDAIRRLIPLCSATEIDEIVTKAAGYAAFSPGERLQRLRAAELDQRVVDMLDGVDFSTPEGDWVSDQIGAYLSGRRRTHEIPATVVDLVLPILTPLCVGSAEKSGRMIQHSLSSWFTVLAQTKNADAALAQAVKEIPAIVADRKVTIKGGLFNSLPEELKSALNIPKPPAQPTAEEYEIASRVLAIYIFGNPEVMYTPRYDNSFMGERPRMNSAANLARDTLGLLDLPPWRHQVSVATYLPRISMRYDADMALLAELRKLLPADAMRAAVYDSLVATAHLRCADPYVKELATQHATVLAASSSLPHRSFAAYLYVNQFGKKDTKPPDLTALLPEDTMRMFHTLYDNRSASRSGQSPRPEVMKLLEQMPKPQAQVAPPMPPAPAAELSNYDRLLMLKTQRRGRTPAAIQLARKVLDQFVDSKQTYVGSNINLPISLLVEAGEFDIYIGQTRERMVKLAWPEADIQRALMLLHTYRITHPVATAFPYAEKLFALVPTDEEAAKIVFTISLERRDADAVSRCLCAMARVSNMAFHRMLSGPYGREIDASQAFALFHGAAAKEFIRQLTATPFGKMDEIDYSSREEYERQFTEMLLFTVREWPEKIEEVFQWTKMGDAKNDFIILRLAKAMLEAKLQDRAMVMLERRFCYSPPSTRADQLRFPSKYASANPRRDVPIPLKELETFGLLQPLAKHAATVEATEWNRVHLCMLRLAASPSLETWRTIVQPAVEASPLSKREELRGACLYAASQVKGSAELRVFVVVESIRNGKPAQRLTELDEPMLLTAELDAPLRDQLFPVLWKNAAEILSSAIGVSNHEGFIEKIMTIMSAVATDAEWKSYLLELRKTKTAIESAAFSHSALTQDVKLDRLRDLAQMICETTKPSKSPSELVLHLIAKLAESGNYDADVAALRPFLFDYDKTNYDKEYEREKLASSRRLVELVTGDLSAILPTMDVQCDESGACEFRWCLAGDGSVAMPRPRERQFKQFDGKFDVTLLVGTEPRKLMPVAKQASAAGVGVGKCKVPPASTFAALMVSARDGSVIHWTDPVAVRRSAARQNLPLPENGTTARGPFDDTPAKDFPIVDAKELLLADVPWEDGLTPTFSVWAMVAGRNADDGEFNVRYIGENVGTRSGTASEYRPITEYIRVSPILQWFKIEFPHTKELPPPGTTRVQLSYRPAHRSVNDRMSKLAAKSWVRLAELKVNIPALPLPRGVAKLGRVPGPLCGITFDAEGKRIAFAGKGRGVGVFDLEAKTFSGWIPFSGKYANAARDSAELLMDGNRVFYMDSVIGVHVIDIIKRTSVSLNQAEILPIQDFDKPRMAISQDGAFLAVYRLGSGCELFHFDENGSPTRRKIETGAIHSFSFDQKNNTLVTIESYRTWILSLADWKNAPPQIEESQRDEPEKKTYEANLSAGSKIDGRDITVKTSASHEWRLSNFEKTWALMFAPPGEFYQNSHDLAWFITPAGSIYRIDFGKIGR